MTTNAQNSPAEILFSHCSCTCGRVKSCRLSLRISSSTTSMENSCNLANLLKWQPSEFRLRRPAKTYSTFTVVQAAPAPAVSRGGSCLVLAVRQRMLRGETNAANMLEFAFGFLALLSTIVTIADHLARRGVRCTMASMDGLAGSLASA